MVRNSKLDVNNKPFGRNANLTTTIRQILTLCWSKQFLSKKEDVVDIFNENFGSIVK